MRVAAFTMVYNEAFFLPLWIGHYVGLCGLRNLYCIDHGSDDGSTRGLPIQVTRLARGRLDARERSFVVSNFHAELLRRYDAVIYADADEFVVLDPREPGDLTGYLARWPGAAVRCAGLDVIQNLEVEGPLDPGRPILAQRRFVKFAEHYCKVVIAGRPVRWGPGFHSCSAIAPVDPNLLLLHLKYADEPVFRRQHALRMAIERSEADRRSGYGHHWRLSLEHSLDLIYGSGSPRQRGNTIGAAGFDAHVAALAARVTHSQAVAEHAELPYAILPGRFADAIAAVDGAAEELAPRRVGSGGASFR